MTTELKNIYEDTSDSDTSIDSPVEKVENIKNIIIQYILIKNIIQ